MYIYELLVLFCVRDWNYILNYCYLKRSLNTWAWNFIKVSCIYILYQKLIFLIPSSPERGWWSDPKEQRNDRSTYKTASFDAQLKDEKSKDSHVWRHDGYFEMEGNPKPAARRRPSFREQKIPADQEKTSKATDDPVMPNPQDHSLNGGGRNDRGHNSRYSDRPIAGGRELNKAQSWRGNFSSGDRFNANSRQRGRDRFTARQGYHPTGGRVEKWKHDLYDEANRSPPPKNEEDQISKIESLLAS